MALIVLLAPVVHTLIPSPVERESVYAVPSSVCQFYGTVTQVWSTRDGYWEVGCSERKGFIFIPK